MRAPRLAKTPDKLLVLGLEKDQLDVMTALDQRIDDIARAFQELPGPDVDPKRDPPQLLLVGEEAFQLIDQRRRYVGYAEIPEILEHPQSCRPPGPRHSRHDNEL